MEQLDQGFTLLGQNVSGTNCFETSVFLLERNLAAVSVENLLQSMKPLLYRRKSRNRK